MFTSAKQYLSKLRRVTKRLPPLDTKERQKAFEEQLPDYGFDPCNEYGVRVCGDDDVVDADLRDYLAWELAQLKYDGKVPPPHVMQLASLFAITGKEIDEHREYCFSQMPWNCVLNQPVANLPPRPSAQVIEFPSDRIVRRVETIIAA
jgi:hypothetical protein